MRASHGRRGLLVAFGGAAVAIAVAAGPVAAANPGTGLAADAAAQVVSTTIAGMSTTLLPCPGGCSGSGYVPGDTDILVPGLTDFVTGAPIAIDTGANQDVVPVEVVDTINVPGDTLLILGEPINHPHSPGTVVSDCAPAGSRIIKVESTAGFVAGYQYIAIDTGAAQEVRLVSSVGTPGIDGTGLGVDIPIPLELTHVAGAPVVFGTPYRKGIEVSPANTTIAPGATEQFTATGIYSDGSTEDMTGLVAWSFLSTLKEEPYAPLPIEVATIDATGLATAVNPGSGSVIATYGAMVGGIGLVVSLGLPGLVDGMSVTLKDISPGTHVVPWTKATITLTVTNTGNNTLFDVTGLHSYARENWGVIGSLAAGASADLIGTFVPTTELPIWGTEVTGFDSNGGLVTGGTFSGTFQFWNVHRIVLTPRTSTIGPGGSQGYQAEGFDANDGADLGDITAQTEFSIAPDGSCTGATCTATTPGDHTVTGLVANGWTGTAVLVVVAGYTPVGTNIAVTPAYAGGISPVELLFDEVTGAGATTLTMDDTAPALPAGYQIGAPATYYELTTTASYDPSVRVCISYGEVTPAPTRLLHYERGAWQDITTDGGPAVICGTTATLSPFALVAPVNAITFNPAPGGVTVGATGFGVSATATSGLPVSYSSKTASICTVGATTGALVLLAAGTCTIAADQLGNAIWGAAAQRTQDVTVTNPIPIPVLAYSGPTKALRGAPITLSATLKTSSGATIAGRTVTFTLNGATFTATTNSYGLASVKTAAPATAGTYPIAIAFAGDTTYAATATSATLTVTSPVPVLTYSGPAKASRGAPITLVAWLRAGPLTPLTGRTVTFTLNGATFTATTNSYGLASVKTAAPATAGTYPITVAFAGDTTYAATSTSVSLRVS